MAQMLGEQPRSPAPPIASLKETINEVSDQISKLKNKTQTLISFYISPEPVPHVIRAYDQPLSILDARAKALSKISFPNLSRLLDQAEAHGANVLKEMVVELLNAVHGLKTVFEERYEHRRPQPFEPIYELLSYREDQLTAFTEHQQSMRVPPESIRPIESIYFCPGAVAMLNNRDSGKISNVSERDLSDQNRSRVSRLGGTYLWWGCPWTGCNFRCKFHMLNSMQSNIHVVDETREHDGLAIEYRSAWLAKCHTFSPQSMPSATNRRNSSFVGWGGSANRDRERDSSSPAQYGCVFCYADGKALNRDRETAFVTGRGLAEHLVERHAKNLPPSLLLQRFRVAVKNKMAHGVRKFDLHFK